MDGRGEAMIRVTAMPADCNPYGSIFGGWMVGQMALGAGSLASRHGHSKALLVAADELLTIAAQAVARERHGEAARDVASGTFTFVMVDEAGRPRPIGPAGSGEMV